MKLKLFMLALLVSAASFCSAQGTQKTFTTCTSTDTVKQVFRGDTVIINCNNAYIINQSILNNYQRSLRSNASCTDIIKTYAALSNTQDSQIMEQNQRFEDLKLKFDSLSNNTDSFLVSTQGSLGQLNDNLGSVSMKLEETKQLLVNTQNLLIKEKENLWKQRLRWGVGGFGVGLAATTLLFLAAR
ncbi:MAG TPA: hypothetical protein VEC12_08860 [Bacteroidia bacterium]|nr:hypothetical protein [Bacteroidia bacterium]